MAGNFLKTLLLWNIHRHLYNENALFKEKSKVSTQFKSWNIASTVGAYVVLAFCHSSLLTLQLPEMPLPWLLWQLGPCFLNFIILFFTLSPSTYEFPSWGAALPVMNFYIHGIMLYILFCIWLFIQYYLLLCAVCVKGSFIFMAVWYSIFGIYCNLSTLLFSISFAAVNNPSVSLASAAHICILLLRLVDSVNLGSQDTN